MFVIIVLQGRTTLQIERSTADRDTAGVSPQLGARGAKPPENIN